MAGPMPCHGELGLRRGRRRCGFVEPRQFHGKALLPPFARRAVKHAGAMCSAGEALALAIQTPATKRVPIALDQASAALMTIGALPADIVNIADIGIANALLHRYAPRHG